MNTIVPVGTAQVGCVVTLPTGAVGAKLTGHPVASTVTPSGVLGHKSLVSIIPSLSASWVETTPLKVGPTEKSI